MASRANQSQKKSDRNPPGSWQVQTAKAKFSEVFRLARTSGPQRITRQGKEAVIVLPAEQFERLTARAKQTGSLVKFFADSPLARTKLNLKREADYGRSVDL